MSESVRELFANVDRWSPTIELMHDTAREMTLVLLTVLTTISLIVFWSEVLGEGGADVLTWPIELEFNALSILLLMWLGCKVGRGIKELNK